MFPVMGINGVMQPRELLSHDTVQKWIHEATSGAAIWGSFSTHCFQQGGAQYWFMFVLIGQYWPLARVYWWSGWAKQEHVGCFLLPFQVLLALSIINFCFSFPFQCDTLIRYLLDELHTYETDHSDTLVLVLHDTNNSLMGEAMLIQLASNEDL